MTSSYVIFSIRPVPWFCFFTSAANVKRELNSCIMFSFVLHKASIIPEYTSPDSISTPGTSVRNSCDKRDQPLKLSRVIFFNCSSLSWSPYSFSILCFHMVISSPIRHFQRMISSTMERCGSNSILSLRIARNLWYVWRLLVNLCAASSTPLKMISSASSPCVFRKVLSWLKVTLTCFLNSSS